MESSYSRNARPSLCCSTTQQRGVLSGYISDSRPAYPWRPSAEVELVVSSVVALSTKAEGGGDWRCWEEEQPDTIYVWRTTTATLIPPPPGIVSAMPAFVLHPHNVQGHLVDLKCKNTPYFHSLLQSGGKKMASLFCSVASVTLLVTQLK